jgi:hypothetical protein
MERDGTHRLIPYRYSDRGRPILNLLAQDDSDLLSDLTELEGATNDRLIGESGGLPGISAIELISGSTLHISLTHPLLTRIRREGGSIAPDEELGMRLSKCKLHKEKLLFIGLPN